MPVGHFLLWRCWCSAPRSDMLLWAFHDFPQLNRSMEHLGTFISVAAAMNFLNMRTMFALCRQKSPHGRYGTTLWSFKLNVIAFPTLQLRFCRLGACEMALLWLSWRRSKVKASLFGAGGSPDSVASLWLRLCQDPRSGTEQLSGIGLWCSHRGEFNLGNTDTAECFILGDDGWWRF